MNTQQKETLLVFFKAVGQPDRARILGLLASRAYSVPELAKILGMKETVVQSNVIKLKKAGLIREDLKKTRLQFDSEALERFNDIVSKPAEPDSLPGRVIQEYVDGPRLKSIPEDKEERQVILEWLMQDFEVGKRYTEANVNHMIQCRFHDALTLRQYLIDSGLLKREGNVYRRPDPEEV